MIRWPEYLPEFAANGKQDITIRQLLTHYSGLPPDVSLEDPWLGKEEGLRRAFAAIPVTAPGVQFRYSDINFIVLGALVEKLSGLTLDQYQQKLSRGTPGCGAHAISSSGELAQPHRAHAIRSWRHAPRAGA